MDWLIGYGVEQIISAGTCGVLADIEENAFLVPVRSAETGNQLPLCSAFSL